MDTQKIILISMNDNTKRSRIQSLCSTLGIGTKLISGNQFTYSLGYLGGIRGIPAHGQDDADPKISAPLSLSVPEILIFQGMTSRELDVFLDAYKQAGIAPVALKAIITPTNVFWSVHKLHRELQAERLSLL